MSDAGSPQRQTRLQRTQQRRSSRRTDTRRGMLIGTKVIAALVAAAVVATTGYISLTYNNFVSNITSLHDVIEQTPSPTATVNGKPVTPKTADVDGKDENVLLVGDDERTGATPAELKLLNTQDDGGGVNTDTMMILHVPADGSKATGISFPRDSYLNVPDMGMTKLNAVYEFGTRNGAGPSGGAKLLISVLQNLTGLHIDHYVAVSLLGFYRIAQALGPLQVCLNQAVDDPYSQTNLPAGVSTLNASQALSFVRQRHDLPRGDIDREVRQQYFLSTEFRKLTSAGTLLDPFKLNKLLKAVSSSLTVDSGLAGAGLLQFAEQMQNLSAGNVTFATIPIVGTPTITLDDGSQLSIVEIDPAKVAAFVQATIGVPTVSTAYTKAVAVSPTTVQVTVVNASNANGVATQADAALAAIGFKTTAPGNSDSAVTMTTISYAPGMEAQAKTLAKYVPGAQVSAGAVGTPLTLTLGQDNLKVTAAPTASSSAPATASTASTGASTPAATAHTSVSAPPPGSTPQAFAAGACIN
jgi:LCP family protein required for cell wall assembly